MTSPAPPPEVRQCQDTDHYLYGAAAVYASENRWGVMHPANGGHWATDADVADWKIMT